MHLSSFNENTVLQKNEQPLDTFVELIYQNEADEIGQPSGQPLQFNVFYSCRGKNARWLFVLMADC